MNFSCSELYPCMAFAQLTYRESLCDIKACLRANQTKLYHMGRRVVALAQHTRQRQLGARLAHLRWLRSFADPISTSIHEDEEFE